MTNTVNLSDESIEKLAEALRVKIVPLTVPYYVDLTYRPWYPGYYYPHPYPYVISRPNSGSVSGSSYGTRVTNG